MKYKPTIQCHTQCGYNRYGGVNMNISYVLHILLDNDVLVGAVGIWPFK